MMAQLSSSIGIIPDSADRGIDIGAAPMDHGRQSPNNRPFSFRRGPLNEPLRRPTDGGDPGNASGRAAALFRDLSRLEPGAPRTFGGASRRGGPHLDAGYAERISMRPPPKAAAHRTGTRPSPRPTARWKSDQSHSIRPFPNTRLRVRNRTMLQFPRGFRFAGSLRENLGDRQGGPGDRLKGPRPGTQSTGRLGGTQGPIRRRGQLPHAPDPRSDDHGFIRSSGDRAGP